VLQVRPLRPDRPPASLLIEAMVAEIDGLYGPAELRNAPSATPQELWAPHGTYLVMEEDGQPVAGGGVKRLRDGLGEIKRMYVVPDARGRGHARRLLYALEDAARGLGHTRLRLDTGPSQPAARRLYESAGYASIPDYNDNGAATFWGEKRLDVCALDPARHLPHAERLLALQRSAYAREAALIGFDGIPPLREALPELLAAGHAWLGRFAGALLVGALAWEQHEGEVEVARLVVDPDHARRGHGAALLDALDALHPGAPMTVMTGRANDPALALYRSRGFAATGEKREVAPGVEILRLRRPARRRARA
jgi:GNAT superfamily N-acetyltransferase